MPDVQIEDVQMEESVNGWRKLSIIGKGSYGFVELWENNKTGEQLALKQIQVPQECKQRVLMRWQQEIDIMKKLSHRNVIDVRETPDELKKLERIYPILAMEYCSLGNLRKVLQMSYCGFSEANVLHFTNDIAAAVSYLHTKQIVHRDLKPENIVLQKINDEIVYKLIDLGYAKDLNQGSICKSFVGTLKYLAPEVYRKEQYTHTADYWSLGTVIFEVITGYRPFLPSYSPVKWYEEVLKKADDHISVQSMPDGNIHFSSELPKCINLCSPLKQSFERWLKTMLMWDADARGNDGKETSDKKWCFQQLDKILEAMILRIYHVSKNNLLCYMLEPNQTIEAIQNIISIEADVPLIHQIIIMRDGHVIDRHKPAKDFLSKNDEEISLFLLDKRYLNGKPDCNIHPKPETVQIILGCGDSRMNNYEPRRLFAEAAYFCEKLKEKSEYIIQSIAASRKALALDYEQILTSKKHPNDIRSQLSIKAEFLAKSVQLHKINLETLQLKSPQTFNSAINNWREMESELEEIKSFVQNIEIKADEFASNNINTSTFNEKFQALQNIIEDLKYTKITADSSFEEIQDSVRRLLESCIRQSEDLCEECHSYRMSLHSSWIKFLETTNQLKEKDQRLDSLQEETISRIWKIIEDTGSNDELNIHSPVQECHPSYSSGNSVESRTLINDNLLLHDNFDKLVADLSVIHINKMKNDPIELK